MSAYQFSNTPWVAARLGLHRSGREWRGTFVLCGYRDALVLGIGRNGAPLAASCGRLLKQPAWAAISVGNLARAVVLPLEVRKVTIAVDNDPSGREAARAAWFRWPAEEAAP